MIDPEAVTPRILVVDDEERIRDACTMVLEDEGYDVAVADNGELGLEMIGEKHYDVILLDLMMPVLSGLDALPKITEMHPDTAVIVITGYATIEHSIEAMKKGAFDFIPKPFTPDQLRTVVDKSIKYTRALQDISDTHSRLRGMVNQLMEGVLTTDRKKRIVLANPAFLTMAGCLEQRIESRDAGEVVDNDEIISLLDEALAQEGGDEIERTKELTLINSDGKEIIVSAHSSPVKNRTGEILGATAVLHDITAVKEMDRMKSEFVSMVSHEIRSPMNSLLAQIKIILDGLAGDVTDKQREILERASGKVNNLVNLVSELLDLAKIEAGIIGREAEEVQLCALLQDQVSFHRAGAEQKNIRLELACDEGLPVFKADRQGLEEVFTNLITNAIKYSPDGSLVSVAAEKTMKGIAIRIADTGYGIPEEDLEEIFTKFYRVKDKNTREIHGTGLGLAIVKSIVEAHGGTISVESKLEQGTSFTIQLSTD